MTEHVVLAMFAVAMIVYRIALAGSRRTNNELKYDLFRERRYSDNLARMDFMAVLRAANVNRQAEWDRGNQITLSYRSNELAGETGEACNVAKKLERERLGIAGSRATVQDYADELADIIICVDLCAAAEGINLLEAVRKKFNATSEKNKLATRL